MNCYCHVAAPCGFCMDFYECYSCGNLKHPDEIGKNEIGDKLLCDSCFEKEQPPERAER